MVRSCILKSRMSTPRQIAASRANEAKPLGPVSLQGKIAACRNSTRHGLFAKNIVLEAEDTGRFLELVECLFQEHHPRTATEKLVVENIPAARWRHWRIWGMQKAAFDDEVAAPSATDDPPLRAVLAWHNSADSMRTHELLRYEMPSTARSPQLSSVSSRPRIGKPTEARSATGFRTGNRSLRTPLDPRDATHLTPQSKKVILQNEPTSPLKILEAARLISRCRGPGPTIGKNLSCKTNPANR